ncbi:MAG: primosomal protein N' [Deltaproteobacteria bacterium]|nr:primosomal protein N' [Deltaproteobacteria bacterium]
MCRFLQIFQVKSTAKFKLTMPQKIFIDVAVELPMDKTFIYSVSDNLSNQAEVGKRVLVPFGKRVVTGFCIGFHGKSDVKGIKDIIDVLDDEPIFDEKRLKFFQWMASYYFASVGETLSLICPGGMNIKSQRHFYATEQDMQERSGVRPVPASLPSNGSIGGSKQVDQGSEKTNLADSIFDVIRNNSGISLGSILNKFRGKSIYSAINGLKNAGLVREELKIRGKIGEKTEAFVSLASENSGFVISDLKIPNSSLHIPHLHKAPLQARVIAYLFEHGETALKVLRSKIGGIDSAVKKLEQKRMVFLTQRKVQRNPLKDAMPQAVLHEPTDEQEKAISAIYQGLRDNSFTPFLLYGVTGSGKTFVYLKAMEQAIALGKQAIFLVPEISLTLWPVRYLTAMFPGKVAVLHSGLSDGERYDEWRRIRDGKVDIVVGARSALFAPLKKLGIIIVDEEHEPSYKQEEGVRYNAKDVSLMMGKMFNLTVVLGSATPSVETFYNAEKGKITPLYLTRRIEDRPMPEIEVVAMKKDRGQGPASASSKQGSGLPLQAVSRGQRQEIISEKLQSLMQKNLGLSYQTILFLNRRGFSNFLICNDCGYTFRCLNCSVSLAMHRGARLLKCHYCDMSMPIPDLCPECQGRQVKPVGLGTEQVEEEVRKMMHGARVARMDRDTTRRKRSHQKILDAVDKGDVDVLVGTQMVAKGHHFPNITLVGIISADTSLNIPDFRSSERTFQLIIQAAGRAGRGDIPGEVIVQTFNPDHFCLRMAAKQDYEGFFEEELMSRQGLLYPPFSRLAILRFEGNKETDVEIVAQKAKRIAENLIKAEVGGQWSGDREKTAHGLQFADIIALGPVQAFLSKLKGKYRWQILLKGKDTKSLHEFIRSILRGLEERKHGKVKLVIDVDPATTI